MLAIVKLFLTVTLASGSLIGFWWLQRKQDERWWRGVTMAGLCGKTILFLAIYLIIPEINRTSDANHFYLPQTLFFLEGGLPYRDYQSSYSPLFPALLAPFVKLWPAAGAVVLLMVILDLWLVGLYLWRGRNRHDPRRWQVAYLYTFSPIVVYWTTLTGYNSVIIALFGLLGLLLAERGKQIWSGVAAALGFLFSKLLMVLLWPAVVFFAAAGWWKRAAPLVLLIGLLGVLYLSGYNVLQPIQSEVEDHTSGNLIFLLLPLFPNLAETVWWNALPLALFGLAFVPLWVGYWRTGQNNQEQAFDGAAAFAAITCLLFMIVSKKAYTFYLPMLTLFLLHAVSRHPHTLRRALWPFSYIGAVTTIEPHLFQIIGEPTRPLFNSGYYLLLVVVDLLLVGSYLYLLLLCYETMGVRQQKSEVANLA